MSTGLISEMIATYEQMYREEVLYPRLERTAMLTEALKAEARDAKAARPPRFPRLQRVLAWRPIRLGPGGTAGNRAPLRRVRPLNRQ
jgi:hypothetical protein